MTTENEKSPPPDGKPAKPEQQQQQQQPQPPLQPSESHAGQGSDSAMKQMRLWEENRASHSGSKGREGPT